MPELQIVRWKKYGHDRIYVKTEQGAEVGVIDLVRGTATLSEAAFAREFSAIAREWISQAPEHAEAVTRSIDLPPPKPLKPLVPPQHDLRAHRPGAAARARRDAIHAQAPLRQTVARLLGVRTDEYSWRVGCAGEEMVGGELAHLEPGWTVLHAVPVGTRGADIDHVVIGPPGVFTINTKRHPDAKVWVGQWAVNVNRAKTDYLRSSRTEARRAGELLTAACGWPVPVQPVIAFVDIAEFTVKQQPDDVHVTTLRQLVDWLQRQPPKLHPIALGQLQEYAADRLTWQ